MSRRISAKNRREIKARNGISTPDCRVLIKGQSIAVRANEFFSYLRLRVIKLHQRKEAENLFIAKIHPLHIAHTGGAVLALQAREQELASNAVARALRSLLGLMIERYGTVDV